MSEGGIEREQPEADNQFFFSRHSKADYKPYDAITQSDNPQAPFREEAQLSLRDKGEIDTNEIGKELAHTEAKKFFERLNPARDRLFFVSSNEARAVECATIYRDEAQVRGFEIVRPEHPRGEYAAEVGGGDIRVLRALSLNTKNMLRNLAFNASEPPVNWEAVDDETKQKWAASRAIIDRDNRGSWGANFHAHSQEISQLWPGVETAQTFYKQNFRQLGRLIHWVNRKLEKELGSEKRTKVLAFGHEDYMVQFLNEAFEEEGIKNCETIGFRVDSTGEKPTIIADFRGKKRLIA